MNRQAFFKALFARDAVLAGFCAGFPAIVLVYICSIGRKEYIDGVEQIPGLFFYILGITIAPIAAMLSCAFLNKGKNQFKIKTVFLGALLTILLCTVFSIGVIIIGTFVFDFLLIDPHPSIRSLRDVLFLVIAYGMIIGGVCSSIVAIPGTLLYILLYKLLGLDKPKHLPKETTTP